MKPGCDEAQDGGRKRAGAHSLCVTNRFPGLQRRDSRIPAKRIEGNTRKKKRSSKDQMYSLKTNNLRSFSSILVKHSG